MQRQLTIFDTLQPLDTAESSIKSGDWIRLLRKTPHAAYWKKGEIVQVEGVHPTQGSARFWNERANCWAYIHPEDMVKVPAPIELNPVQPIARGEDSTPAPEAVDTESIHPIARDTESNCPHSQSHQSSVTSLDTESNCPHSEIDSVSPNPIALDTESEPAPEPIDSVSGPVSRYKARGTARGGEYYRFSYRAGAKMKHVHIPGGNTGSILAQQRAAEVMELLAAGVPAIEICDRIRSWSGRITW